MNVPLVPGAPVIRIRSIAVMGGVDVTSEPPRCSPGKDLDRA